MTEVPLPLLLFFLSRRSGPARRIDSIVATIAYKQRERIRFTRVDIDERPDLAARYEVTSVPAVVILSRGEVVGRLDRVAKGPQLHRFIDSHLKTGQDMPVSPALPESAA